MPFRPKVTAESVYPYRVTFKGPGPLPRRVYDRKEAAVKFIYYMTLKEAEKLHRKLASPDGLEVMVIPLTISQRQWLRKILDVSIQCVKDHIAYNTEKPIEDRSLEERTS